MQVHWRFNDLLEAGERQDAPKSVALQFIDSRLMPTLSAALEPVFSRRIVGYCGGRCPGELGRLTMYPILESGRSKNVSQRLLLAGSSLLGGRLYWLLLTQSGPTRTLSALSSLCVFPNCGREPGRRRL